LEFSDGHSRFARDNMTHLSDDGLMVRFRSLGDLVTLA